MRAEAPRKIGQIAIVGAQHAPLARRQRLGREKGKSRGIAQIPGQLTIGASTVSVGRVFEQQQPARAAKRANILNVGRNQSSDVDRDYGPRLFPDLRLNLRQATRQGLRVNVAEDGPTSGQQRGVGRGNERIRRYHHFPPFDSPIAQGYL